MLVLEALARYDRIYYLIQYLAGLRLGATVGEIAEKFNKPERTVRRDIKSVKAMPGVNLKRTKGPGRMVRYRIENKDVTSRPLVFNIYEILSLHFIKGFAHFNDIPFIRTNLSEVFQKINEAAGNDIPSGKNLFFNRVSSLFAVSKGLGGKVYTDTDVTFLKTLIDAALDNRVCELEYGVGDDVKKYKIAPLHFFNYRDAIYLISKDQKDHIIKTFILQRIKGINPLDKHFKYPSRFKLQRFLSRPFGLEDDKHTIKLKFLPACKDYILDREWYPNEAKEILKDGSLLLTFESDLNLILLGWIKGFGSMVTVLEPTELREEIIKDLRESLNRYEG